MWKFNQHIEHLLYYQRHCLCGSELHYIEIQLESYGPRQTHVPYDRMHVLCAKRRLYCHDAAFHKNKVG